jgi:hypothetical protein
MRIIQKQKTYWLSKLFVSLFKTFSFFNKPSQNS